MSRSGRLAQPIDLRVLRTSTAQVATIEDNRECSEDQPVGARSLCAGMAVGGEQRGPEGPRSRAAFGRRGIRALYLQ
jgi:hypothetical protein